MAPGIDADNGTLPLVEDSGLSKVSIGLPNIHDEDNYEPDDDLPPLPPKDSQLELSADKVNPIESYFNPLGLTRANSIYSLSRASVSSQLSQLTSLSLPDAESLASSIQSIPTAPAAARALVGASGQIQQWIRKASDLLNGLDADDDVEWAAAAGREGLGDVDVAVSKFETLINVYVTAIEKLQARADITDVTSETLQEVVSQMEKTMIEWEGLRKSLRQIKNQVEIAMEWEELWNSVLGDIGMEMESLARLVFEMEEKRHKSLTADREGENNGLDIGELETIVEEGPTNSSSSAGARIKIPSLFPSDTATTTTTTTKNANPQDDSNLLALFARMQPLRASLDFLPMRLSTFHMRAQLTFPTACQELQDRRVQLEKEYKRLESDAEALRRELGEDKWNLVFRNAGRQAQKMCESVERSINKLQDSLDPDNQQYNLSLAKKVESYEAKKMHYGPAIERVLGIIQKGINDRLTINGEILRLREELFLRWENLQKEMKEMSSIIDELNSNLKDQQLRDSVSSIVTIDRSALGSATDTPGSSPASSVVMTNGGKSPSTPGLNGSSRRSSSTSNRPSLSRGHVNSSTAPMTSNNSSRKSVAASAKPRELSITPSTGRYRQASPHTPISSSGNASHRPRWSTSTNTNDLVVGHHFKPVSATSPPRSHSKLPTPSRTSVMRTSSAASNFSLRSPKGRRICSSPAPSGMPRPPSALSRPRFSTTNYTADLPLRERMSSSLSPGRASAEPNSTEQSRLAKRTSMSLLPSMMTRKLSTATSETSAAPDTMPTPTIHPRASTSLGRRRVSLLPQPRSRRASAQDDDGQDVRRLCRSSTPNPPNVNKPRWRF